MTDQSAPTPRPDEAELSVEVWAYNPTTNSPVKQMTRGKLRILEPAGYVATEAPTGQDREPEQEPAGFVPPGRTTSGGRAASRSTGEPEQKEQS